MVGGGIKDWDPNNAVGKVRLKNSNGDIIEVNKYSCYPENKEGNIVAAIGGFSYFTGKPTDDPINCVRDDGDGSLAQRGGLQRIA